MCRCGRADYQSLLERDWALTRQLRCTMSAGASTTRDKALDEFVWLLQISGAVPAQPY